MRVAILTEGGNQRGLGHLVRCSAIYEAFYDAGIKPEVYIDTVGDINYSYDNFAYQKSNWLSCENSIVEMIKNFDVVIIDSYVAGYSFYEKISNTVKIAVFIDDNLRIDYPKGMVVNCSLYAPKMFANKKKEHSDYLLGCRYIPIRAVFQEVSKIKLSTKFDQILIMFGGTDIADLSVKTLKLLDEGSFSALKKVVVTGKRQVANNIMQKFSNVEVLLNPSPEILAEKMTTSSLAISAAGMTLYELAYLQIPTIAIFVADNQRQGLLELVQRGFIEEFLNYDDANLLEKVKYRVNFLMENYAEIKEKALVGRDIVDGFGSKRIVDKIREAYNEKALILGGSHRDIPLINAAKKLGFFVITLGDRDYYIGHKFSDKSYKIDFNNLDKVSDIIEKEKINALVPGCGESALVSTVILGKKYKIGNFDDLEIIDIIHNKWKFKKFCQANDIAVPKGISITSIENIDLKKISFPCIVKPLHLSGGKGVSIQAVPKLIYII